MLNFRQESHQTARQFLRISEEVKRQPTLQKAHRAWPPSGTSQNSQNMQSLTVKSLVQVSSANWLLFCLSWTSSPIAMEQWCIFLGSGTYHLGDDCSQLCWCQSLDGVHANPSQADKAEMYRLVGLCICTGTHFHSGITVIIVSFCKCSLVCFRPSCFQLCVNI